MLEGIEGKGCLGLEQKEVADARMTKVWFVGVEG